MYLYFKGVANIERKKKIAFTQIAIYIAMLLYRLLVPVYAFVVSVCAFVGVTFQKTQTISPLQASQTLILCYCSGILSPF